jgi:hypothetical protein
MNRFLTKKKNNNNNIDPASTSLSPSQSSSKKWKKSKKDVVELKPQLDLGAALPSIDDFRTSLLMPNLSTRFSMLREQDDPHSLLGKAADDSVLQPQRNSRLLDFGFSNNNNNLNDIAEVSSINSSIRPPFVQDRSGSYASEEDYGADNNFNSDSSVMSRARPGEGNVLFGGRQKVYKISNASTRSIGGSSERALGRLVYDDDVSMSAFQRYRQQERERLQALGADWDSDSIPVSPATDPDHNHRVSDDQPKGLGLSGTDTGFSFLKRNSDSTTNSLPSQDPATSSPLTSIASQSIGTAISTPATLPKSSPNPTVPGLERSMTKRRLYEQGLNQHIQDQQASAMTRLNNINQRQRAPTQPLPLNHSRSIGNLQDRRAYKPYALHNPDSPLLRHAVPPLNTKFGTSVSSTASPITSSYPQSPISPVHTELHSALDQNDRGKATALGVFNKPSQQFDEQQYLKRQMQMGRDNDESPRDTPMKASPVSQNGSSRQTSAEHPPFGQYVSKDGATSRQASTEYSPQESGLARFDSARQNSASEASQRSRSRSISTSGKITAAPSNPALAVFQRAAMQNRVAHGDSPEQAAVATFDNNNRTFFGSSDDEEDENDEEYDPLGLPIFSNRLSSTTPISASQHPALRDNHIPEVDEEDEEQERAGFPFTEPAVHILNTAAGAEERPEVDSPTMGMRGGIGGMISQHLRNTSDVSSIFPQNPTLADNASSISHNTYPSERRLSGLSSAWNIEDLDNYYDNMPSRVSTISANTVSKGQDLTPLPLRTSPRSYPRPSTSDEIVEDASWQPEYKPQHQRDTSTATQQEREAFANELAARQKAIQEKMRSIVESDSRGPSPAPTAGGALKAFGMLKTKPSHEAMNLKQVGNSTRMLGMGLSAAQPIDRNPTYEDKISQPMNPGAQWPLGPGPVVQPPKPQADSEIGRTPPQQARDGSRNRSGSDASGARSRSRSRSIGMAVGASSDAPAMPVQRASAEVNQYRSASMEGRGRLRSNSRALGVHPSARPPAASSQSQSPASFSSHVMSPPLGAATGASKAAFSKANIPNMPIIPNLKPRGELLRKKNINKFDISEPTLVSSTSNIDTVDLPPGASLKNGMDEIYALEQQSVATRRRKLFGFGRESASQETSRERAGEAVTSPPLSLNGFSSPPMRSIVPSFGSQEQYMGSRRPSGTDVSSHYAQPLGRKQSFDTSQTAAGRARFDAIGSPVLNEAGMF